MHIFFANNTEGSGTYLKGVKDQVMQEQLINEDNCLADRSIFSCDDDTILITALPLDHQFKQDTEQILNLKNFINLSPMQNTISLCRDVEEDKELFKKLIDLIKAQNGNTEIYAYSNTPEFCGLVAELRERGCIFTTPEMPEKEFYWTQSFLDSKGGFRQIVQMISGWEKAVKMPWGIICAKPTEARKIGLVLFSQGKGFVVKTNWGQCGEGLLIIRHNNGYKDYQEVSEFLKNEFKKEDYWERAPLVVEEFIPPNHVIGGGAPNVEGFIDEQGNVKLLYSCGMRMTRQGNFQGVEIGHEVFSEDVDRKIRRITRAIGEAFSDFGYRGFFEVDMQAAMNGEIYCLESNMRRTGGTHVFQGMQRLFKEEFNKKHFVSNNWFEHSALKKMDYAKLRETLQSIWFNESQRTGFLPTVVSSFNTGHMGYIVVGNNKKETDEIEEKLKQLLGSNV